MSQLRLFVCLSPLAVIVGCSASSATPKPISTAIASPTNTLAVTTASVSVLAKAPRCTVGGKPSTDKPLTIWRVTGGNVVE